jgi:hypothetical protein
MIIGRTTQKAISLIPLSYLQKHYDDIGILIKYC